MSASQPLVSVIIVNWNGEKWLKKCLGSLCAQTYKNTEIVFVDNASTDDSVEFVHKNYPEVIIVQSEINRGFAGGNNLGVTHSHGEYILLLNNDTWVKNNFLAELMSQYDTVKSDVIAPLESSYAGERQVRYIMTIDIFGHGFGIHNTNRQSFYLPGACLLFSKKLYNETDGLDKDFFMYCEEVDWFWRLHLLGKTIYQCNDIFVFHAGIGNISDGMRYKKFLWRNQNTLQMLLKNYSWYNLLWVLPIYLIQNIFEFLTFLLVLKPKIAWSYIGGWWFNIRYFPRTMKKRSLIQKKRLVSDFQVMRDMYHGFGKAVHLLRFITAEKE